MGTNAYIVFKTKPFEGYKMGMPEFKGKQAIAIPQKKQQEAKQLKKDLCIINKNSRQLEYMILSRDEVPLSVAEFKDKWGRMETYQLYYFIWKPHKQLALL